MPGRTGLPGHPELTMAGKLDGKKVLEDLYKRNVLLQTVSESENSVYPRLDE